MAIDLYFNDSGLTALHASSEEVAEWTNKSSSGQSDGENRLLQSQEATSSGRNAFGPSITNTSSSGEKTKYTFICECFFMTARVLNLGLLKAFSDFKHLVQVIKLYMWADRMPHNNHEVLLVVNFEHQGLSSHQLYFL